MPAGDRAILVSVVDNPTRHVGIDGEGWDGTHFTACRDPQKRVTNAYIPTDFRKAQALAWTTDAHCVPYAAFTSLGEPHPKHPRINVGDGLTWARTYGFHPRIQVLRLDLDFEDHHGKRWTADTLASVEEQFSSWDREGLLTFGWSQSRGGLKFDHILPEPITPEEYPAYVRGFLQYLRDLGVKIKTGHETRGILLGLPAPHRVLPHFPVVLDLSKVTWNDHFRLHDVVRRGERLRDHRYPLLEIRDCSPLWTPLPFPQEELTLGTSARLRLRAAEIKSSQETLPPPAWASSLSELWEARAAQIAHAIRGIPKGTWNDLFLSLSGALCTLKVDPALIPRLVWTVSMHAGTGNPDKDRQTAERTVDRALRGRPSTGLRTLMRRWPTVGITVGSILQWTPATEKVREEREVRRATLAAMKTVYDQLEDHPFTLLCAETGLGKTHEALEKAVTRALRGEHTGFAVPTNELAEKRMYLLLRDRCDALGIPVARLFGAQSIKPPDPRACLYHDRARHLPMYTNSLFCAGIKDASGRAEKCERYDSCAVREGIETNNVWRSAGRAGFRGRIVIGNHTLLPRVIDEIGQGGLLFLDEPPPVVESLVLTAEDQRAIHACRMAFDRNYMERMEPVLQAAWSFPYLLDGATAEGPTDARTVFGGIEGIERALPADWKGTHPPLSGDRARALRNFQSPVDGQLEGRAARALRTLYEIARDANGSFLHLETALGTLEGLVQERPLASNDQRAAWTQARDDARTLEALLKRELFEVARDGGVLDDATQAVLAHDSEASWRLEQSLQEALFDAAREKGDLDPGALRQILEGAEATDFLERDWAHRLKIEEAHATVRALCLETRDLSAVARLYAVEGQLGWPPTEIQLGGVLGGATPLAAKVTLTHVKKGGRSELHITRLHRSFAQALGRPLSPGGCNVILDANAPTNLPLYARAWGVPADTLRMHRFTAQDGCFAQRVHVLTVASRKELLPDRRIHLEMLLQKHLPIALAHMERTDQAFPSATPRPFAFVTFLPLALALREALGQPWEAARWNPAWGDLGACVEAIRGLLGPLSGRLSAEWYGNIRGADHLKHTSIITLGDPRPDPESIWEVAEFLELDAAAAQNLIQSMARDELEQAHGRGRTTVYSQREQFPLHIGEITPGGTGWTREVNLFAFPTAPTRGGDHRVVRGLVAKNGAEEVMRAIYLFHPPGRQRGGVVRLSQATGIPERTLHRWSSGVEPTAEGLEKIREAVEKLVRE